MKRNIDLEKLEKRVDDLRKEAHEIKVLILEIKREEGIHKNDDKVLRHIEVETKNEGNLPQKKQQNKRIENNEPVDWERQIGQVWLPRIFIFVLLLGIVWAFKAASDYGLLNNPIKVLLGYIAASFLIYIGHKQISENRAALGQVLLGGSIVLLFIVTFAAHVLYLLFPMFLALCANIIWLILGLYLGQRHNSQPLVIITAIGGYLIPFLLESASPNIPNFIIFETILYLSLLVFAINKKYAILYHIAFFFLHLTLLFGALLISNGNTELFAISILIQHAFLLIVFFMYSLFIKQQIGIMFTSFLLTLAWTKATYSDPQFEWVVLIFVLVYSVLSIVFWKSEVRRSTSLSITTIALATLLIHRFDIENILGVLLVQGLLSIYLGILAKSLMKQVIGAIIYVYSGLAIFSTMFTDIFSIEFINWILLLLSIYVITYFVPYFSWIKKKDWKTVYRILQITSMVLLLFFITLVINALTKNQSVNIQLMSVSFAWGIYAFGSIVFGFIREHKPLRVFGLILLFITLGKLLFVDLYFLSLFIRSILFIGLGSIGILGSRIFYQNKK
ncbi:DUF2339 domain-containing protein [Litchfieldia alkalitelluris]|uniref:DUF2339 domain-containing protein n=1 Tax=Litchfieldia alkalitelluris TaxID=304268 RepID=UPI000996C70A|nr:DUF2339 domain-containing protein [Litchfieldia alkalitelluris]